LACGLRRQTDQRTAVMNQIAVANAPLMPSDSVRPHARGHSAVDAHCVRAARFSFSAIERLTYGTQKIRECTRDDGVLSRASHTHPSLGTEATAANTRTRARANSRTSTATSGPHDTGRPYRHRGRRGVQHSAPDDQRRRTHQGRRCPAASSGTACQRVNKRLQPDDWNCSWSPRPQHDHAFSLHRQN
jgi:hypothetical protein